MTQEAILFIKWFVSILAMSAAVKLIIIDGVDRLVKQIRRRCARKIAKRRLEARKKRETYEAWKFRMSDADYYGD